MSNPVLEIRLRKINKTYFENDIVSGVVFISAKNELSHQGINLQLLGNINLEISGKTVGRFDALYNSVKPIELIRKSIELQKSSKLPQGSIEIPFEIPLTLNTGASTGIKRLLETYRGVFINITYTLMAEIKRSMLQKTFSTTCDILVQYKEAVGNDDIANHKPVKFEINSQNITSIKDGSKVPNFSIVGQIDSCEISMKVPISGYVLVEHCDRPIRSVELQLVRVETCGCAEGYSKESTEIENLQMGDGDVAHKLEIPLYLLLPRIFTCPTVNSVNFRINFEINIVVLFADNTLVVESLPLKITRF